MVVRAVVGEESRLLKAEERLGETGKTVEVGLLIGKLSPKLDRGFIYDLVPTPPNDAAQPPSSLIQPPSSSSSSSSNNNNNNNKKKAAPSLSIDHDWVAEHSRQVSRMLVGGIHVVGIYVCLPEPVFKNSTLLLCQAVKSVADAAPFSESCSDERLLVHLCFSPRRWTCRNCSLASNITSTSLRPCDFKMGKVLGSLQGFRCIYKFDIRLPVSETSVKTLNHALRDAISVHARELKGAKAMIDGDLVNVDEDEPCTSGGLHEVELLLPLTKDESLEASRQKVVAGVLVFSGTLCSYSYLNSKEPVSQVATEIKEDIIMSLQNRLDMMSDEAEREMVAASADGSETNNEATRTQSVYQIILEPLRKEFKLPFPRRVFVPWLADSCICDYLLSGETYEVLKDHFVELLSMDAPADATLLEPEQELISLSMRTFWGVAAPAYQATDTVLTERKSIYEAIEGDGSRISAIRPSNGMLGGLILLIAIILGMLLYARNSGQI